MTTLLRPVDLRARGFEALVASLGWINAVRFLQQFEKSTLNYTEEREHLLPELGVAELVRQSTALARASAS